MLEALGKGFGAADVRRCFACLQQEGMAYSAFLMLGGPGETRDSVTESVTCLEAFQPAMVSVTVGVRVYPGTEMARIARAEGVLSAADPLLTPVFYLSPSVRGWIWEYLGPVMQRNPTWVL